MSLHSVINNKQRAGDKLKLPGIAGNRREEVSRYNNTTCLNHAPITSKNRYHFFSDTINFMQGRVIANRPITIVFRARKTEVEIACFTMYNCGFYLYLGRKLEVDGQYTTQKTLWDA